MLLFLADSASYFLTCKFKTMKQIKFILPALALGMLFLTMHSCSKSDGYTPAATVDTTSDHKVSIQASQFSPASLTMLIGTKVTWTNMDADTHSIVSDDATSFNSGNITTAATFSFTPPALGTYAYHCGIHPAVKGIIYVVNR